MWFFRKKYKWVTLFSENVEHVLLSCIKLKTIGRLVTFWHTNCSLNISTNKNYQFEWPLKAWEYQSRDHKIKAYVN